MLNRDLLKAVVVTLLWSGAGAASAAPVLWVGDSNGILGTVDVATGSVDVIGNMGVVMTDIAFDPDGNLFGIAFSNLYRINATTAASQLVGNLGITANSLVFDTAGTLYAANAALHTVNTTTGATSLIGNGGDPYNSSGDLAFVGGQLYLSSTFGNDSLIRLNVVTGTGTSIGPIGQSAVFGLASPNGTELYGLADTEILAINVLTGAGDELLDYAGQGLGAAFGSAFVSEALEPVPVPAAVWMFGTGIAALWSCRRRRAES